MTNEELAQHWGIPLREVKRISDIMNATFYCGTAQSKTDRLFYGVMFRWHESPGGNRTPLLTASSKQGYQTQEEATRNWNDWLDEMELPELRCKMMGVPKDAFKALIKVPESPRVVQHHTVSVCHSKENIKS